MSPRLVVIETPYGGENIGDNIEYAQKCMEDSLRRGEAPMLSHLLYTQVLDDSDPMQRVLGMEAGWAWIAVADVVVYRDRGISGGMYRGIRKAVELGKQIEYRLLEKSNA